MTQKGGGGPKTLEELRERMRALDVETLLFLRTYREQERQLRKDAVVSVVNSLIAVAGGAVALWSQFAPTVSSWIVAGTALGIAAALSLATLLTTKRKLSSALSHTLRTAGEHAPAPQSEAEARLREELINEITGEGRA